MLPEVGLNTSLTLCTVFDHNYLPQALTMIESVENTTRLHIEWHILALTDKCYEQLLNLEESKNWKVFRITDLEDDEFVKLSWSRPWKEFCWTAASVFLYRTVQITETKYSGYIDADCYFFNDIEFFINEMYESSVLIFKHNFSPDRMTWLHSSGVYNVGLILGKTDTNFVSCLKRWRQQVVTECVNDPELGKCGDQTYLNEWPDRYSFVKVSRRLGACLAPWNLNNFSEVCIRDNLIDGHPIDFFHFHGFSILCKLTAYILYIPAGGYHIKVNNYLDIYRSYISHLASIHQRLKIPMPRISVSSIKKNVLRNWRQFEMIRA